MATRGPERRRVIFRAAGFAFATFIGFVIFEGIVILGVYGLYHSIQVPDILGSSLNVLGLDAIGLVVGNTFAFLLNERVTVRRLGHSVGKGWHDGSVRWGKYQLTSLLGSVVIVAVQLALLAAVSLSPILGSVVGGIVAFPVSYVVSMHVVWGIRPFDG
jgi:putative flippase GtrA